MRRYTPKWLETQEIRALLESVDSTRDLAMILLGYLYGLRAGEIGILRMSDVDMQAKTIRITRLKGSLSGVYPLLPAASKALVAHFRGRGRAPGPIFLSRNHRAISRYRLDEIFKKYCVAAGIAPDRSCWKALKHSLCVHLIARGESLLAVKGFVGHADVRSTMCYLGLAGQNVMDTGRRLAESDFGGRRGRG